MWSEKGTGDQWRQLNANERLRMLHFPSNYFENIKLTEDEGCALAGDPFSTKIFGRLLHAAGLGIWPCLKITMVNGQLVASEKEKEERRQPHDDAPIGAERGRITLEGRETIPESTAARLRAALLNAVTEKGPYGLVMGAEWKLRGFKTLRQLLPAVRQLPFLNQEKFDGIDVKVVTENDQTQWVRLPTGTEVLFLWTLSGRASLQWGEGQLRIQGSISKVKIAPGLDTIEVKLFSRDAVLGMAYQLNGRKSKAAMKEANRAGLTPHQPDEMVTPEYGEPVLRTGALEVERWRIRSLQEEDPELNPYIVLYEKGATELRKLYGQKTAELTMRHQEDFKMSDGILGRWIHLPGGGRDRKSTRLNSSHSSVSRMPSSA